MAPFDLMDLIDCLDTVDTEEAFLVTFVDCLLGMLETFDVFLDIVEIVDIFLSPCTGQLLWVPELGCYHCNDNVLSCQGNYIKFLVDSV